MLQSMPRFVRGHTHRRHTADLDDTADEQARLGAELRTALDTGQFRLVYQPIVALPHGQTVALLQRAAVVNAWIRSDSSRGLTGSAGDDAGSRHFRNCP